MGIPDGIRLTPQGYYEVAQKPCEEELARYYADLYYQNSLSKTYAEEYLPEEIEHTRNKNREAADIIKKHFGGVLAGKRFVDIGCGEGFALQCFVSEGCDVLGVDYSEFGLQRHNPEMLKHFRQDDIVGFVMRALGDGAKFDIINLDNVLEHVVDPVGLCSNLGKLLAERGVLRVQVPNDFSLTQNELFRLGKVTRHFWVGLPAHLSYFNSESLKNLLKSLGFELIAMTGDLPIDFFLFNDQTNYVEHPEVGKGCHMAKVRIENFLYRIDFGRSLELFQTLAAMGLGRVTTAYVTK